MARMALGGRHVWRSLSSRWAVTLVAILGPLLAAVIIAPYGKGNVAWVVLAALLAFIVLAQIRSWYAARSRE